MSHIKAAREWAGYTSANRASKALKMDQSHYNKLELEVFQPSADTLRDLAKGFGCSTDNLLGLKPLPRRAAKAAS